MNKQFKLNAITIMGLLVAFAMMNNPAKSANPMTTEQIIAELRELTVPNHPFPKLIPVSSALKSPQAEEINLGNYRPKPKPTTLLNTLNDNGNPTAKATAPRSPREISRDYFRVCGSSAAEAILSTGLGLFGMNYSFIVRGIASRVGPFMGDQAFNGYTYTLNAAEDYFGDKRVEKTIDAAIIGVTWTTGFAKTCVNTASNYVFG